MTARAGGSADNEGVRMSMTTGRVSMAKGEAGF